MKKIATLKHIDKFHYFYDSGRTGEVRKLVLENLTASQRSWLTKRPWKVTVNQGKIELYARMGKYVPVEQEESVADILFATYAI
jgi:hypothetical protein